VRSVEVGRDEKNDGWLRALVGGVRMGDKARPRPAGESDPWLWRGRCFCEASMPASLRSAAKPRFRGRLKTAAGGAILANGPV
jgi:hypothetical protein